MFVFSVLSPVQNDADHSPRAIIPEMTSLVHLPDSLLLAALFMLDARSLRRVGRCCKEMHELSGDSSLYAGRGQSTLARMHRFAVRPPSIRHLRSLFGPQSPCRVPALDLTALPSPPGAAELFPATAYECVRLLRIRDVTLWCDMQGAEYLLRDVFGGAGALCHPEPRAGSSLPRCSADRGLLHLIVSNPASDAFELAQSVGFSRLASARAFPPLPSSVATRRTSSSALLSSASTAAASRFSGRGFGAGSGSSSASTLSFDYTDAHLGLLCFHLSPSLRSLTLPFAPCAFTSLGLIKLKFLTQLRTLVIGLREFAADLLSLPAAPADGSRLRSLSLGLRALRSEAATIQGARRSDAAHTQVAQRRRDEAARQRRRQQELEQRGSFVRPISADDASALLEEQLDPSDPFVLLSTRFVGLRSLALHWTHLRSAEGIDDLTSAQIALLSRMESLTQLKLAKRPHAEGQATQQSVRGPQVYRAVDSLLRVAAASFLGSEAASSVPSTELILRSQQSADEEPPPSSFVSRTPLHLYNLMHGSCLAPLASLPLRKLELEGFALFEGTTAAWADSAHPLSSSLHSLTLNGCDLRPGSALHLASLTRLAYLELNRCRLPGDSFSQLMSSWPQSPTHPLEELIVCACIDERGDDVCLHSEWPLETEQQLSPWTHLHRLPQLQTLFIQHADSPGAYSEKHALHFQSLMIQHWAAIGSFLRSGHCALQSLTLSHASFSSEAAWSALCNAAGDPCRSLLRLDGAYSRGLSDAILSQLAALAPRLLRLDISYARRDDSISPLADATSSPYLLSDPADPRPRVATPSSSPAPLPDDDAKAIQPSVEDLECASVDSPLCPYSPAGLLAAVRALPDLRSLRALCSSAADAGLLMRAEWLQRCREANPLCSIVSSRYQ